MVKNKKGALEFSFAWIFAIIAGMFILFLAIYGVTKFMDVSKSSQGAQGALAIGILTNPLESSFDTAKRILIKTPVQTRIYTDCNMNSFFGKQSIGISEETYNKWSDKESHSFSNKYIFSENPVEGKTFYIFSKPFELPFKVADLVYLTSVSDKYCFKNAPLDIKGELGDLTGSNLSTNENFFTKLSDCPSESINVCFNQIGNNCEVNVNTVLNYVEKDGEKMYYNGDALMYAAIFSDKYDYECQLDRLMKRTEELSMIYRDKSNILFQKTGCVSGLDSNLIQLSNVAGSFKNSEDINVVSGVAEEISIVNENNYGGCKLW